MGKLKGAKEAIKTRQIEPRPGDARLSDTFVCCHYCQATKQFFSMLCVNQGWGAGRHQRLCSVAFCLRRTKLFFCPSKYTTSGGPSPSRQLKDREGQNHSILALLEVWKAATPFSSRELLKLGVVAHACNPNSWKAEEGEMQGGQPGSHARPCLKKSEHWSIRGRGSRRQRCGEQVQPLAID